MTPTGVAGGVPPATRRTSLQAMLEARSVAVVGASPRPGSFGERVLIELSRSPSRPDIHLVNPKYTEIAGRPCLRSLDAIADPVDLVLMCVGDGALLDQMERAARREDRSAIIYGSAFAGGGASATAELRRAVAAVAAGAGMEVCGGGCMGFVNVAHGLRAIGYIEPYPLEPGSIALVTHSGSAFSALLRTDRGFRWSLAVSSGQELVTPAAAYLDYALGLEQTKVVALLLETLRHTPRLRSALERAEQQNVPVVALTVGNSNAGRAMVAAHSGALAGDDAAWEALFEAHGVLRVGDLQEMTDTLELLAADRRPRSPAGAGG
ncbi:MAG TPA: CoA-binding protein, partial [Acidimicrobiales bacterium]|nr:CoA-binding protein [Acidimicrobiales bacterium]